MGGGLYNDFGTVGFTASTVNGNTATASGGSADGGGIFNDGVVTLTGTSVVANQPNNCAPPGSVPGCI